MVDEELLLDRQLCFALYSASRAVTGLYRPVLDELGLTYPQYLVLLVLWDRGSQPVRELGASLHLDSGTLSPLLKRMETAGLITRTRRTDDERSVLISPTQAALDLKARARAVPRKLLAARDPDLRGQLVHLQAMLTEILGVTA